MDADRESLQMILELIVKYIWVYLLLVGKSLLLSSFIIMYRKQCQGISATAVHPGMVRTELADGWITSSDSFGRRMQPVMRAVNSVLSSLWLEPPSQAVRTILYAALAPSPEVRMKYRKASLIANLCRSNHAKKGTAFNY